MTAPHPYVSIRSRDQWRRVAHENTALTVAEDGVVLASVKEPLSSAASGSDIAYAFMAFDPYCRLYTLRPETSQIIFCRNIANPNDTECVALLAEPATALGEFNWSPGQTQSDTLSGLSVDSASHLFLSDASADRIWVFDMLDRRLIRFAQLTAGAKPGDSDADGLELYVTTEYGVGSITSSSEFTLLNGALAGTRFDRVAASNGMLCVLENAGKADARVIAWNYPDQTYPAPFASDIIFTNPNQLVIAFGVNDLFEKHQVSFGNGQWSRIGDGHLRSKGYDGRGIVRTPDGRVGYYSQERFRYALPVKAELNTRGRIISFALDSGAYQNRWGLAFVDACIPRNCQMRINFYASDELEDTFLITRSKALNDSDFDELLAPERSPSMPKDSAFKSFSNDSIDEALKLFRRGASDELVWSEDRENERLVTYEAPVMAPAGRYLWVAIELAGTSTISPSVSGLRVQKTGHRWLNQLPKLYSRDQGVEAFLQRYLALPEAILNEFDVSSLTRHALLDPSSCREEWLVWLASFVGLAFDERFNPDTRRQLITEAAWLFRFRGTVGGLQRFLQIYADNQFGSGTVVQIVERFKFRGHSAFQDPHDPNIKEGTVLGVDYRIGAGVAGEADSEVTEVSGSDPYSHRFVVLIAASMSVDESDVVNNIISVHRPAHTAFEVCTVDAGMRIGRGLYLEMNSFVGQSAGFQPLHLESGTLGRNGILGTPKTATSNTGGRLGISARMG